MKPNQIHPRPRRLIRLPALRAKLGHIGVSTVYKYMRDGLLPRPIKFGNIAAWDEDAIDDAIDAAERDEAAS
jgi:predicted DNA-binding transcriptional regulator AlpA